jgi:hypothetical protein
MRPLNHSSRKTSQFFTTLADKERGEEAAYFAKQDADAKAALRISVEDILAKDDSDSTKQELVDFIESKKSKEGLNLMDWKMALPVSLIVGIPAFGHDIIVLDAESQLLAVFILFCSTVYTQAGGMIHSSLQENTKNIMKQLEAVDEAQLTDLKSEIEVNKKLLNLEKDVTLLHGVMDDLAVAHAEAMNYEEKHKFRGTIQSKLDNLVALEEQASQAFRTRMLDDVKDTVLKTFTDDKKAKDSALDAAIKVLAGGEGTPMGKDVVGTEFGKALKSYRDTYSKVKPSDDPILVQLEKDIAAVTVIPTFSTEGGNVYDSIKV